MRIPASRRSRLLSIFGLMGILFVGLSAANLLGQSTVYRDVVVPNGLEFQDGNEEIGFPFSADSIRYQQLYRASQFNDLNATGGGWIYDMSFRIDQLTGYPFVATYSNLQINLSTTSRVPNTMERDFAANIGPDEKVVLAANSKTVDAIGPIFFHINFNFSQPFYYDPALGNLLVDIRFNGLSGDPPFLDGYFDSQTQVISSIYGDYSAATSSQIQLYEGLVTQFGTYQVPEPSTWALFVLGLGGLAWARRPRKR